MCNTDWWNSVSFEGYDQMQLYSYNCSKSSWVTNWVPVSKLQKFSTDKFDIYVVIAGTNYPLVAAGTLLLADMKFAAQMQAACMLQSEYARARDFWVNARGGRSRSRSTIMVLQSLSDQVCLSLRHSVLWLIALIIQWLGMLTWISHGVRGREKAMMPIEVWYKCTR